jgi:predicted nucleotidyltransferase
MFKTYQYATNDEKLIASLKYIVNVKGAHDNLQKKSYGQKIGKRKAKMGKGMW